jgi:50S ribosomal protein L16 3-hydroxylase
VKKNKLFINGECYQMNSRIRHVLQRFAAEQTIAPGSTLDQEVIELLYQWYKYGYITLINDVNCYFK